MLINLKTILREAKAANCCVPAINVYNLETVQAVMAAAEAEQSPIIIAFGEGYLKHVSMKTVSGLVQSVDSGTLPIVLHLDHAKEESSIAWALDCGFTSVMFDGSHLPLSQNLERTAKVVALASRYGATVEGELGYLNPEDGRECLIVIDKFTQVDDAHRYVTESGIDALAIAVGNAHGIYREKPKLDFARIEALAGAVPCPLVLHGSSGIAESDLKKAIARGISKINVNTEVALAGSQAAKELLDREDNVRFERVMATARSKMTETIRKFITLCR